MKEVWEGHGPAETNVICKAGTTQVFAIGFLIDFFFSFFLFLKASHLRSNKIQFSSF